jgi:hypothetical protein
MQQAIVGMDGEPSIAKAGQHSLEQLAPDIPQSMAWIGRIVQMQK